METQIEAIATYGRSAGSSRVRLFEWIDFTGIKAREETYLNTANISISTLLSKPVSLLRTENRLRQLKHRNPKNHLVISRRASPFSNGDLESKLLRASPRSVYDFDDALHSIERNGIQRFWSTSKTWERSVEAADFVIAGNDYLAEKASGLSENIVVIPSCVNPDDYQKKLDYSIRMPRAVWIGSPSTEKYLSTISRALVYLHKKIGLRLTVISGGSATLGVLDQMVDRVEWTPLNFMSLLAEADIGIMPLTDGEWARGKCAYKLLQYGATALPMIGSPVGTNRDVLEDSNNLCAVDNEEWIELLEEFFIMNDTRRFELGINSLRTIEKNYSFQAWEKTWRATVGVKE